MMPSNNENVMEKVKIYAVVDGEYREVMELQGEITLHECDEQLWQYDYVRVVRCKDCKYLVKSEYVCKLLSNNYEPCVYVEPEGFCSYGERRTE